MKKILVMALAFGMFAPALMTAQEKKQKSPEEQFAALDKNNDKKLSKEEFLGNTEGEKKTKKENRFKALDKDSDGFVSLEEYKAGTAKKK